MAGRVKKLKFFENILIDNKKLISDHGYRSILISRYLRGIKCYNPPNTIIDLEINAQNKISKIPESINNYHQLSYICLKCGLLIPSEVIIASLVRENKKENNSIQLKESLGDDKKSEKITQKMVQCPNIKCSEEYYPSFTSTKMDTTQNNAKNCIFLSPSIFLGGVYSYLLAPLNNSNSHPQNNSFHSSIQNEIKK